MKRTFAIAVAILVSTAQAESYTGASLLREIAKWDQIVQDGTGTVWDSYRAGAALGYVLGVFDTAGPERIPCPPAAWEAIDVVKKYIEANPARQREPAHVLVIEAAQRTVYCK